jgi:hypothetical protein
MASGLGFFDAAPGALSSSEEDEEVAEEEEEEEAQPAQQPEQPVADTTPQPAAGTCAARRVSVHVAHAHGGHCALRCLTLAA